MKSNFKLLKFSFSYIIIFMFLSTLNVLSQTIGNKNEGSLTDSSKNAMQSARFKCTQTITVNIIYVKINTSGSGHIKCAIYSDRKGNPETFLMETNELIDPGAGWKSFDLKSGLTLTTGTCYHLALWTDDSGYVICCSAGGVGTGYRELTYNSWPGSFGTINSWTSCTYCIYAIGTVTDRCTNPAIMVYPQSIIRDVGTIAAFSFKSNGTSLFYSWKREGKHNWII